MPASLCRRTLRGVNRRDFLRVIAAAALLGATHPARAAGADSTELVREAIRRQRVLRLRYGGHLRFVEPHALGISAGGHRALLAWQIEGGSRSEPPSGWRTFLLAETGEVSLTVRGFSPRPSYQRDKAGLRDIELEVTREPDAASSPPAKARG
ncbi:MAG: twin-arginine translocation signal domain-containing protein [Opitutae bacterium]|nr:twin-arginine translocation signal domain-containing protein [Opitutae bacterium]